MLTHLRSQFLLFALTIVLCCVVYPAILFAIGQTVFRSQAEGSVLYDKTGKPVGSRLIAQPFTGEGFFHPRPSAVSFNAAASGASNWGASNPKLRERVTSVLGPMLKYRNGRAVGPDIVRWVRESLTQDRTIISRWAVLDSGLAERWGALNLKTLSEWEKDHFSETRRWHEENPQQNMPPAVLATFFFASYAAGVTTAWPESSEVDLQAAFFGLWWSVHPHVDVEPVPADLVMASSSGLDPHITLKAALYQLDRVATKRAAHLQRDPGALKQEIEALLRKNAYAPLGGIAGVELINVLEINLALQEHYGSTN